tara:strand:- start:97 stop:297 length:201 start_codon:yes stop_codon:yes gene_type:complete
MRWLTTDEFEVPLRLAFLQDEWIPIAVGAVLGFLVCDAGAHHAGVRQHAALNSALVKDHGQACVAP